MYDSGHIFYGRWCAGMINVGFALVMAQPCATMWQVLPCLGGTPKGATRSGRHVLRPGLRTRAYSCDGCKGMSANEVRCAECIVG